MHDTFNQPNEAATQLATGQKTMNSAAWKVETGQLGLTDILENTIVTTTNTPISNHCDKSFTV